MHAAVQILMEEQGEQGPSETVQAISDEPRFVAVFVSEVKLTCTLLLITISSVFQPVPEQKD